MKKIIFFVLLAAVSTLASAQKTPGNVVVVTLDGLRWQELFNGADSLLTFDKAAGYNTRYIQGKFWAGSSKVRREKLMPFMWTRIVSKGVLLGNRTLGSQVNVSNPHWFSYPGYNEIFTGFADSTVNSNAKIPNKNENVFEFLNKLPEFKGKTASFASWDVFSSIFNEKRSGFLVNDGFRDLPGKLTEKQIALNRLQHELPDLFHGSERLDVATFRIGLEYMKINKPKLIHFGFGDTDEFAHGGLYDFYLDAAHKSDAWIKELWEHIESDPFYAGKTTLIITTDHGRGQAKLGLWKDHGRQVDGSDQIWIALIGPSINFQGESTLKAQYYQGQIAATIAKLAGKQFKANHPVMQPLPVIAK
ncbi:MULTISPECIES: alkaline phosphatase family protein [Dyadobacter]|jgi:hypothetical protein|uniref:Phosphoglyceromutase n=1 Tax=Dyadobacter psychrotolerans TaxID=2541721 RepID=A0A4R5DMF4_9BACT|nr:alkaline phosphatase family protein [Dyadobacter psychrotolerans]TDE13274.1 phosphoglyceromutase [Dyadobacter psychrotolerans]